MHVNHFDLFVVGVFLHNKRWINKVWFIDVISTMSSMLQWVAQLWLEAQCKSAQGQLRLCFGIFTDPHSLAQFKRVFCWQPVQGVSGLLSYVTCDRLQHARESCEEKQIKKWMNGWMDVFSWAYITKTGFISVSEKILYSVSYPDTGPWLANVQ